MSSAAVSTHSGAGPLSLMSCVRESSPLQDFDSDTEKHVGTKKKFWNRIKWFKRKNKVIEDSVLPVSDYIPASESLRSRSTSELSIEEPPRKRNGNSMYPGLSVSHDSVFHSPHSGSETDLDAAHSSSSLCIPNQQQADLQTELSERLRLRRSGGVRGDTSEDDEGLPHSPCNSPTTTDTLDKTASKDLPNKSHSTCSDGSLLSVGSSDIEEDSLISHTKQTSENRHDLDLNSTSLPLNHSAAHHRLAVRPKKTHGVPKRRRVQQLPTTIEVNEDSSLRSSSPEVNAKKSALELYNTTRNHASLSEIQLKSSSLPLGLAAPESDTHNLTKNRSNFGSKSQDGLEEQTEKEEKSDKSFFERLFPRRSAKKKKSKQQDEKKEEKKIKLEEHYVRHEEKKKSEEYKSTNERYNIRDETHTYYKQTESSYRRYESKPIPAVRSGAAYRQRILPNDIPDSPDSSRKKEEAPKNQLPDIISTSPLQIELENKLKQRLTLSSPSQSFEVIEQIDDQVNGPKSPTVRYFEDTRPKIKLAGLSSLQQKVMTLNEDENDYHHFKSLTDFPSQKTSVLLTKSHSFKTTKSSNTSNKNIFNVEPKENHMSKSSSLNSVKVTETNDVNDVKVSKIHTEKIEHQRNVKQQTIEIKCDITVGENDNLDEQISRCMMETKNICEGFPEKNNVTVSGPSHTAVVNIKNAEFYSTEETRTQIEVLEKNPSISITKINVQHEKEEKSPKTSPIIVEAKPLIVKSPNKIPDQIKSKPAFDFDVDKSLSRKFSKDDVEIIDKDENDEILKSSPIFMITSIASTVPLFKKNEKITPKKASIISITPESPTRDKSIISMKSSSLDSLVSDQMDSTDKSSQDSLDNVIDKSLNSKERSDGVVLRKKSSVKEKKEEEPELMKVFARRSLKLRDCENENLSQQLSVMMNENCDKARDSDKENQTDSPVKERRKSTFKETKVDPVTRKSDEVVPRKKSTSNDEETQEKLKESDNKDLNIKENKDKEPLIESNLVHSKPIPIRTNSRTENNSVEIADVILRKNSLEQNYQRSISLTNSKTADNSQKILRQQFNSRRRTDNWITNMRNEESDKDKELKDEDSKEDIVNELIIEPKNFNQRKAEWEKRAQEAQKKSTP